MLFNSHSRLSKNIKVVCSLLCSVQMKFPWSWNKISEYFYEEKKTRVVRHPSSPLRFICFNELNNIWGLCDTKDSVPPNQLIGFVLCYSLLIHVPAKTPEHEITDYFDGKISVLCHLDLFEFTFQLLLKTSYYGSRVGCGPWSGFHKKGFYFLCQ